MYAVAENRISVKPYLHRTRATRAVRATRATQFCIISALNTSVNISNVARVDLAERQYRTSHPASKSESDASTQNYNLDVRVNADADAKAWWKRALTRDAEVARKPAEVNVESRSFE